MIKQWNACILPGECFNIEECFRSFSDVRQYRLGIDHHLPKLVQALSANILNLFSGLILLHQHPWFFPVDVLIGSIGELHDEPGDFTVLP